jgi:hypothetical protein
MARLVALSGSVLFQRLSNGVLFTQNTNLWVRIPCFFPPSSLHWFPVLFAENGIYMYRGDLWKVLSWGSGRIMRNAYAANRLYEPSIKFNKTVCWLICLLCAPLNTTNYWTLRPWCHITLCDYSSTDFSVPSQKIRFTLIAFPQPGEQWTRMD